MRTILWCLVCAMAFVPLSAKVEDHLKVLSDKEGNHAMRNIDYVYTINLDERPEKFASCTAQLHPYGIYPYRFSAINGWTLPYEVINDVGVVYQPGMPTNLMGTYYPLDGSGPLHEVMQVSGRNYFCHCMSRGAVAIVLSHLSVLQDALDSGYKTIWVMEDDIEVIQNPHVLSDLIDSLDAFVGEDGWDVLFTDRDTKNQNGSYVPCTGVARRPNFSPADSWRFGRREDVGGIFDRVGARYGAYSMIVRRSGMEKISQFIKEHSVFLPYDMEFQFPNDIRLYAVKNDVISTQIRAASDNGGANYLNKE